MKKLLIVTILLTVSKLIFTQEVALEIIKSFNDYRVFYEVDNRFKIIAENISCDSLYITTDNGIIRNDDKNLDRCEYIFHPKEFKYTTFNIYSLNGNDTLFITKKYVRLYPFPMTVYVNNKTEYNIKNISYDINLFNLHKNFDIRIDATNTNLDFSVGAKEFCISVLDNQKKEIYSKCVGNLNYDNGELLKQELDSLNIQAGYKMYINDIIYINNYFDYNEDLKYIQVYFYKKSE